MPVIITGNNTPTAGGVTYGDGSTYVNTAAGAAGGVLYSAGSSAPAFTAAGTSGQVLQSNGASAPTWSTPSSGAVSLLATVTASNSSTVNFNSTYLTSTYDVYMLTMNSVQPDTDSVYITIDASANNGSSFPYSWKNTGTGFSSNGTSAQGVGGGQNRLTGGLSASATAQLLSTTAGRTFNCNLYFYKPSATQIFQCTWNSTWISDQNSLCWVGMSGTPNSSTAINYIRFAMSSGNIASGTFRLYGISNS
jgi:hypothetical protein